MYLIGQCKGHVPGGNLKESNENAQKQAEGGVPRPHSACTRIGINSYLCRCGGYKALDELQTGGEIARNCSPLFGRG